VSGDELGPARNVNLGTLAHDLAVLEIGTRLGKEPGQSFKPERRLRHERARAAAVSRYGRENVGQKGHVPDGLVTFDDGRTAAVEVELTQKNATRLKKIVNAYKTSFDEDEVWYYVRGEALRARIAELCGGMSKFKIMEV